MKVKEVFGGWRNQDKAQRLADFFGVEILARNVTGRGKEVGVGGAGEIKLTVHTVGFDGPPVEPRWAEGRRETYIMGNDLCFPT